MGGSELGLIGILREIDLWRMMNEGLVLVKLCELEVNV